MNRRALLSGLALAPLVAALPKPNPVEPDWAAFKEATEPFYVPRVIQLPAGAWTQWIKLPSGGAALLLGGCKLSAASLATIRAGLV